MPKRRSAFIRIAFLALLTVVIPQRTVIPEGDAPDRWAIIIGIDHYGDEQIGDLKWAVSDAEGVYDALTTTPGGFDAANVLLMIPGAEQQDHRPNRANILMMLKRWLARPEAEDTLLIYFAGQSVEQGGVSYLLPQDAQRESPELTAIRTSYLGEALSACKATKRMLILDAYHGEENRMGGALTRELSSAERMVSLTSCRPGEISYDWDDKGHTVFAYYLIEALKGDADTGDGILWASEVNVYVWDNVRRWGAQRGLQQHPTYNAIDVEGAIVLSGEMSKAPQLSSPSISNPLQEDGTGFGSLSIEALTENQPTDATAFVDGKEVGATPHTIQTIAVGPHQVRVSKPLYHDYQETVDIAKDQDHTVKAALDPAFGALEVTSTPSGAAVEVLDEDGRRHGVGTTPLQMAKLRSGTYQIQVNRAPYPPQHRTIIVEDGQKTTTSFSLIPQIGTLTVDSQPQGAAVFLEGQEWGTTPLTMEIDSGHYALKLQKELYFAWFGEVEVRAGETTAISPPLSPNFGVLDVQVKPTDSTILVDGAEMGRTPAVLKLSPGIHRVEIDGGKKYVPLIRPSLFIERNQTEQLTGSLKRRMGQLLVISTPAEAQIYIDETYKGVTPESFHLLPGTYELRLSKAGFGDYQESVTITADQTVVRNERLQESILQERSRLSTGPPPRINGDDGVQMILIPAGAFQMGSDDGNSDEQPVHTVYLDAFYIDSYEVTVGQYKQFIKATGHRALPTRVSTYLLTDQHPVVGVNWYDAMAYARWAGKTLPTEAQWEKAARGGLLRKRYPWGDTVSHEDANYSGIADRDRWEHAAPVGSFPANEYSLYDMAGNVWEWCMDAYESDFYAKSPRNNPVAGGLISFIQEDTTNNTIRRVLRGGSWVDNVINLRVANRLSTLPINGGVDIGFRCVKAIFP